jgi:hypothetical protein
MPIFIMYYISIHKMQYYVFQLRLLSLLNINHLFYTSGTLAYAFNYGRTMEFLFRCLSVIVTCDSYSIARPGNARNGI